MRNLPIINQFLRRYVLPMAAVFLIAQSSVAQASCTDRNASLNGTTCMDTYEPAHLGGDNATQTLVLQDAAGVVISGNIVTSAHINTTLTYSLLDATTMAKLCWANLFIEDKASPIISCPADAVISCIASSDPAVNTTLGLATATDCSGTPTISYSDVVAVNQCNTTGDNGTYAAVITRTWLAVDAMGLSSTCTQTISINRADLANVTFPSDYTAACASGVTLSTAASVTGYPQYDPDGAGGEDAVDIVPGADNGYCMLVSFFEDIALDKCGASSHTRRSWNVMNMCAAGVENVISDPATEQIINITQSAPVFNAVAAVTLPADVGIASAHNGCRSTATLPTATLAALCTDQTVGDITIITPVGTTTNGGAIPSPGLGLGDHTISYTVTDNCGTITSLDVVITIADQTPPSAICEDVRLTLSGATDQIEAAAFNEGSRDNCSSTVYFKAARLDHNNNDATIGTYGDEVVVMCSDVDVNIDGGTGDVRVGLLVFDQDPSIAANWSTNEVPASITSNDTNAEPLSNFLGNISFCWSEADIENKLAPTVSCSNYTYATSGSSCIPAVPSVDATTGALSDDTANTGGISFNAICGQNLVSIASSDAFGDWSCTGTTSTRILTRTNTFYYDTDNTFDRTQVAGSVAGGHEETLTCTQTITITDATPIEITAPAATTLALTSGCADLDLNDPNTTASLTALLAKIADTDKVTISGNECESIGLAYGVNNLSIVGTTVTLTLSTTVTATGTNVHCTNQTLPFSFSQAVTLTGTDCGLETPVFASATVLPSCNADGSLAGFATVQLDGQDEGDFIFTWQEVGGSVIADETSQTVPASKLTQGSSYVVSASNRLNLALTTESTDTIKIATDYCCVSPVESTTFGGTSMSITPKTGISATDFSAAGPYTITWYTGTEALAANVLATNVLEITGLDNATTYSYVITQTGNTSCDVGNSVTTNAARVINGFISTEFGTPVQNVSVSLEANQAAGAINGGDIMSQIMTDEQGVFEFDNVDLPSLNKLTVSKDDDDRDDISTRDLLIMARHVLGIKQISSPYAYIAADVSGNGRISTGDMVLMQKMILGVMGDFPNNSSWRFVKEDHVFDDMNTVLDYDFPEYVTFTGEETAEELGDLNFIAVKVGDLAGAYGSELQGSDGSTKTLSLATENQQLLPGSIIEVPIEVGATQRLSGYQHAYKFDHDKLVFTGIDFGTDLGLGDHNFGYKHLGEGFLTTSWYETEDKDIEAGTVIYKLRFEVKQATQLKDVLSISSEYTKAEAYFDGDDLGEVEFTINEAIGDRLMVVNTPNPFKSSTQIKYDAPQAGNALIRVADIAGREVYRLQQDAVRGSNLLTINKSDLNNAGIYILKVDLNGASVTQKIMMIE